MDDIVETVRAVERRRLRALVELDLDLADRLHAPSFTLVTPGGRTMSKATYLGALRRGDFRYERFEPVSAIEVLASTSLAAIRYRSAIHFVDADGAEDITEAWHTDCYEHMAAEWRAVWSHATRASA